MTQEDKRFYNRIWAMYEDQGMTKVIAVIEETTGHDPEQIAQHFERSGIDVKHNSSSTKAS